jgi:hypothetical protein
MPSSLKSLWVTGEASVPEHLSTQDSSICSGVVVMLWFMVFLFAGLWWQGLEDARRLREIRRLLRSVGCVDATPSPEPPTPHQLLGDIARPLASSSRYRRTELCQRFG